MFYYLYNIYEKKFKFWENPKYINLYYLYKNCFKDNMFF